MKIDRNSFLSLLLVALCFGNVNSSAVASPPADDVKALVTRFMVDIWSQGDMDAIDEIIADDFVFTLSFAKTSNKNAFRAMVKANRIAFENLTYTPLDIVVDANKASCRWRMTSKHVGTWRDIPGTGKNVSIDGISIFEIRDGKFSSAFVQNDVIGLMDQIGGVEYTAQKMKNVDLVSRYVNDILVRADFTTFSKYASPDFHIDRSAVPEGITGKEGLNTQMAMLYKAFPDLDLKMADVIAQGDKVLVRFEAPGTHTGEFAGIPATGKVATWKGLVLYQVKDGKLIRAWATWDDYGLVMQLQQK
jgi:steroid delta-isomerase-like uncharacterized protein